jgi:hypothetical protein
MTERKFKKGDKIEMLQDCGMLKKGEIRILDKLSPTGTLVAWRYKPISGCTCIYKWKIVEEDWDV